MTLRRFLIEREIPQVGSFEREQLAAAAAKSNEVLRQLGSDIQWLESFVIADRTFCDVSTFPVIRAPARRETNRIALLPLL